MDSRYPFPSTCSPQRPTPLAINFEMECGYSDLPVYADRNSSTTVLFDTLTSPPSYTYGDNCWSEEDFSHQTFDFAYPSLSSQPTTDEFDSISDFLNFPPDSTIQRHTEQPLHRARDIQHRQDSPDLAIQLTPFADVAVRLLQGQDGIEDPNALGRKLLLWAAEEGDEMAIQMLLRREDVDPNSKSMFGLISLIVAVQNGHEAMVQLLLVRGTLTQSIPLPGD